MIWRQAAPMDAPRGHLKGLSSRGMRRVPVNPPMKALGGRNSMWGKNSFDDGERRKKSGGERLKSGLASTATKITYGSSVIWWHLMAGKKQPRRGDFASGKYT